ncbi:carbohydrate-binding protein [Bacteroides sp. 51]|uniref:carbohydrate-binding protein n=1 Tax=Bacteroides sp. 51 TaxID=2302938 RepID=UPI0013D8D95A|nr:carbohydrate-binding protein [Bacteroides sp. 51]NDV83045.1 hypothetical protein [Bacteroides sp. 51]
MKTRSIVAVFLLFILGGCSQKTSSTKTESEARTPFKDEKFSTTPQVIPGDVYCAYYDFGGEGIAYHDIDTTNNGSGSLNPIDGSYLHSFRVNEGVDISYTKAEWDISEYNKVEMSLELLYVGWTEPGEWIKYTVNVKQSGTYAISVLYTSNQGGEISITADNSSKSVTIDIPSTFDGADPNTTRQWHHWNRVTGEKPLTLSEGVQTITLKTEKIGQMNYAILSFEPVQ